MDRVTRLKWDAASVGYDFMNSRGPHKRWAAPKRAFYAPMRGKVLFLAVGTGLDVEFFPSGQDVTGLDISAGMLEKAQSRVREYAGKINLLETDAQEMALADSTFDQVFTSCTFCSVPDPLQGLREVNRVLKPGGELRMFEHTGSRWFPFNLMLRAMNPLTRRLGPEVIRDTVSNVSRAGFALREVRNLYLDVVKTIVAVKRASYG